MTFSQRPSPSHCRQVAACLCLVLPFLATPVQAGPIDIQFRPPTQSIAIGVTANIGVWLASNDSANHTVSAADVVFGWTPSLLQLTGLSNSGAVSLLSSGFPGVSPNESNPPADGDGYYSALAFLGSPVTVTPAGVLLTTFKFKGLAATPATTVLVLTSAGNPPVRSAVYDGVVPNLDVTGSLGSAQVTVTPEPSGIGLIVLGGLSISVARARVARASRPCSHHQDVSDRKWRSCPTDT